MKTERTKRISMIFAAAVATLFVATAARAQATQTTPLSNPLTQMDANQTVDRIQQKSLDDPRAAGAYKAFEKAKNTDKRIKLGEDFINRFPNDYRTQAVYEELAQAYYAKHDLTSFYSCTDRGITLYPDDATLLALTGWVIPHEYKPGDPNGAKNLAKAETYEQRALSALGTMKTPNSMSDKQFDAYKKQVSALAHGGLGLIYFRQSKFQDSVTEMQQATENIASPDATDYLILGADYQNLNQMKNAADAFNRCAQIPGPLQSGCKQYANSSAKQAGDAK
jgi:tetratricopeptide (TPR) repeat protein